MKLRVIGTRVRVLDLADGRMIPDYFAERQAAARYAAEQIFRHRLDEERQNTETLEAEVMRLRALLAEQGKADPLHPEG